MLNIFYTSNNNDFEKKSVSTNEIYHHNVYIFNLIYLKKTFKFLKKDINSNNALH